MDRQFEDRHRRYWNLQQLALQARPEVGPQRAQSLRELAEQPLSLSSLVRRELRREKVVESRQRPQKRWKRRSVVVVSAASQFLQQRRREAVARTAESVNAGAGRRLNGRLSARQLASKLVGRVEMEPRFVGERVIADFMPGVRNRPQRGAVAVESRVLTDDEERNHEPSGSQELQRPRHHDVQVAGETLPAPVTVGLQVRPLIIKIERQARERFRHGSVRRVSLWRHLADRRRHRRLCGKWMGGALA